MKSSTLVAASSAAMVLATPLDKREYHTETEIVNVWVTVTATSGDVVPTVVPTPVAPAPAPTMPAAKARPVVAPKEPEPVVVYETVEAPAPKPTPESTPDDNVVWVTVTAGGQQEPPKETYKAQPLPTPSPSPKPDPVVVEAPAAPPPEQPSYTEEPQGKPTDMKSMSVVAHNIHRSNHSAPAVEWNDRIAGYAANSAASCKFAHDMDQGDKDYGQNIAMWGVSDGAAKLGDAGAIGMAIHDMWYNGEVILFDPSWYGQANPPNMDATFEKWGHFSQLVWKESTSVGCHAQFCAKGTMYDDMDAWYMVCNYHPRGNMGGGYGTNVLKPLNKATVTNPSS